MTNTFAVGDAHRRNPDVAIRFTVGYGGGPIPMITIPFDYEEWRRKRTNLLGNGWRPPAVDTSSSSPLNTIAR